jgi:hypothetical protein
MRWFWFGVAVLCFTLALGPDVQIGGLTIPLPYAIVHRLLQGLYRFPLRFALPGSLALLVFIGMSFRLRWRRLVACTGVLLIFLDGSLLAPFPVQEPLKDLPIYHQIGAEPDDYVVLHVPVTVHSGWAQVGGTLGQRAQYVQFWTHKKQLNGALSRIPDNEHVFYEEPPLMSFLAGTNGFVAPRPFDPEAASRELSRLIGAWPIGYVLVHTDWLTPEKALEVVQFLNAQPDLCFVSQEENVLAYRARVRGCPDLVSPNGLRIPFGQVGDDRYLLENWYVRENVGGVAARWMHDTARLTIPVKPGQSYQLRLSALGYGPDRQVSILANGQPIGQVRLPENWTEHTFDIPAQVIGAGPALTLTLQADGSLSPAQRAGSGDQRSLSAAVAWLELIPVQR